VPRGGPSGGDGGRGGDVIMQASQQHNTLIHFRYNPEHKAERGRHGEGSNCTGSDGDSITLVPVGTSLFDAETGELVHDFALPGREFCDWPRAGRGGAGNQHFATPVHQAPRESSRGGWAKSGLTGWS
jgi:GTP-binding protein